MDFFFLNYSQRFMIMPYNISLHNKNWKCQKRGSEIYNFFLIIMKAHRKLTYRRIYRISIYVPKLCKIVEGHSLFFIYLGVNYIYSRKILRVFFILLKMLRKYVVK